MNKVLWSVKPHRFLHLVTAKSQVYWLWHWTFNLKHGQWFAYVHIPFIRFIKNNCQCGFGLCFGKNAIDLIYHW